MGRAPTAGIAFALRFPGRPVGMMRDRPHLLSADPPGSGILTRISGFGLLGTASHD